MKRLVAVLAIAAALGAAAEPLSALGFANVNVGDPLEDQQMPALEGGRQPWLGKARASVFVFFRPGQDHSMDLLARLARLEAEFAGRPVRFVAIVSGSAPAEEARAAARQAGIRMPVLVDAGDALYGKLGVRLHPVLGIADAQHRLAAYEHFRMVDMEEIVRSRIRWVLGEISGAEMDRVTSPPRSTMPGEDPRLVARRDLNLGRLLLQKGSFDKALEAALRAEARDPSSGAAHALAGQALAGQGRCADAVKEFETALRLDPGDAASARGRESCAGR